MKAELIVMPPQTMTVLPEKAEPLTQADYEAVKSSMKCWRDVLICKMLRATGLRIAEVLGSRSSKKARSGLLVLHMKEEGPYWYIMVVRGKKKGQDEYERVYLPPTLALELVEYIKGNRLKPDDKLFNINTRMAEYIFRDAGIAGIHRSVHPHELRALYTKTLLDGGIPVAAAAKMLGHQDSRTTEKHYYNLSREQRWEIQKRIPV